MKEIKMKKEFMLKKLLPFTLLIFAISCGELSNPLDPDKNSRPVDNTDPVVDSLESNGMRALNQSGDYYIVETDETDSGGSQTTYRGYVHKECINEGKKARCATISEEVECTPDVYGCYPGMTTRKMMQRTYLNFCSQQKIQAFDVVSIRPCHADIIEVKSGYSAPR